MKIFRARKDLKFKFIFCCSFSWAVPSSWYSIEYELLLAISQNWNGIYFFFLVLWSCKHKLKCDALIAYNFSSFLFALGLKWVFFFCGDLRRNKSQGKEHKSLLCFFESAKSLRQYPTASESHKMSRTGMKNNKKMSA